MNLSNLYNIAFDMLEQKKSNSFGFSLNDNSTVTVISTNDDSIFKATNGNKIVNGKLINTCSEMEAISCMVKENKSKIDTIVTLNVENGDFIMPCENCIELILQINNENIDCNIMTNINDSIKLKNLIDKHEEVKKVQENVSKHISPIEAEIIESIDDWENGWDSSQEDDTPNETTLSKKLDDDINNPMPSNSAHISKNMPSGYYQSMYTNSIPTPVDSSISVSPINSDSSKPFKSSSTISEIMKKNGLSNADKKDFNKQRLFNAFTTDTVTSSNNVNTTEKQLLSKKELLKLAKERKKMAKRDAKILEATNKKK